ncbi:MAG: hypothetical protein P8N30_05235 [Tateyamaria sp.]|jgi:hypothetical protein|nr:hypothetical protein [Tateyamaria sp.]
MKGIFGEFATSIRFGAVFLDVGAGLGVSCFKRGVNDPELEAIL